MTNTAPYDPAICDLVRRIESGSPTLRIVIVLVKVTQKQMEDYFDDNVLEGILISVDL